MDFNQCILVGRINGKVKEGRTQTGGSYVWMPLYIEARSNANSTENNYHQTIHVMAFKKTVVDYLNKVKARSGNKVIVFGFVSAFPDEIKGKAVTVNAINANAIFVIKTKADDEKSEEE
jgi:hypothetical protein